MQSIFAQLWSANYSRDPERKDRGFAACNFLSLSRTVPERSRGLARWNLFFYLNPASAVMPSFSARPIGFTPPDGYRLSNPSVAQLGNEIVVLQRAVNFTLAKDCAYRTPAEAPIHTRNFLLRLDSDLTVSSASEILPPADIPDPTFREGQGFEDVRLFVWRGELWCVTCVRELTEEGWCDQVLARIDESTTGQARLTDWRSLHPQGPQRHEKNLMPGAVGGELQFICLCDPTKLVDDQARRAAETTPPIAADQFRCGSQAIAFDGGFLALIHEVSERDRKRHYQHRFVWFDAASRLRRVSRPFYFRKQGVEFAAGLAWHPDGERLIVAYGVDDRESWIAAVAAKEVRGLLEDAERLPWGAAPAAKGLTRAPAQPEAKPSGRTFDLFDTLIARRCVDAQAIFKIVERESGCEGFSDARISVEGKIYASGHPYTLDDIYARLAQVLCLPSERCEQLKSMELATEKANFFPITQHYREFAHNDAIVSDMYLPAPFLAAIINEISGLRPRLFFLSSHGKRDGSAWPQVQERMQILEHVGDHPVTDKQSAESAGIPARLTTVSRRTPIEHELAYGGLTALSNLIRESRLTMWADDPAVRRAQILQVQINFPLLFLASLHLRNLAVAQGWDNILMSGRDCYLWHQLYRRLAPLLPGAPPATYVYTSRITRAHPTSSYLAYFTQVRSGQRNVIVDLCGTGWSLSRLIERSPTPDTEIFLLHRIDMSHLMQRYESFGPFAKSVKINSTFHRAPMGADNDVLEDLNRAPHGLVKDVRQMSGGFVPVYSPSADSAELGPLIRIHHAAFEHACNLLELIKGPEIRSMLEVPLTPLIESVYRRMSGIYADLAAFRAQKMAEESVVWKALAGAQRELEQA
jgi:hypothetical protein